MYGNILQKRYNLSKKFDVSGDMFELNGRDVFASLILYCVASIQMSIADYGTVRSSSQTAVVFCPLNREEPLALLFYFFLSWLLGKVLSSQSLLASCMTHVNLRASLCWKWQPLQPLGHKIYKQVICAHGYPSM